YGGRCVWKGAGPGPLLVKASDFGPDISVTVVDIPGATNQKVVVVECEKLRKAGEVTPKFFQVALLAEQAGEVYPLTLEVYHQPADLLRLYGETIPPESRGR